MTSPPSDGLIWRATHRAPYPKSLQSTKVSTTEPGRTSLKSIDDTAFGIVIVSSRDTGELLPGNVKKGPLADLHLGNTLLPP